MAHLGKKSTVQVRQVYEILVMECEFLSTGFGLKR
jgi:hypothetical protein